MLTILFMNIASQWVFIESGGGGDKAQTYKQSFFGQPGKSARAYGAATTHAHRPFQLRTLHHLKATCWTP
jgi:hypothetical protein